MNGGAQEDKECDTAISIYGGWLPIFCGVSLCSKQCVHLYPLTPTQILFIVLLCSLHPFS